MEGCLICGRELRYLLEDRQMTCVLCGAVEQSKTCCSEGHYVCSRCHTQGIDQIVALCLQETGRDPIALLQNMMRLPTCHMHGPEHHVMVGAALLTAYHNAGGALDLPSALKEMLRRGEQVPGGACGFWGACGAGVSTGQFWSIATGATPLARESWGLANRMTARALERIGAVGGPRCCKRDSFLAVLAAVSFAEEALGITMDASVPVCGFSAQNAQCLRDRCPFFGGAL